MSNGIHQCPDCGDVLMAGTDDHPLRDCSCANPVEFDGVRCHPNWKVPNHYHPNWLNPRFWRAMRMRGQNG